MVRHAQSEANVASARLGAGEVSAIWPFLTMGADAPLSDMGRQQLAAAHAQLVGFIEERGVQLIAHSPLVRAQQTAHALFGDCGAPLVELPFVRAARHSRVGRRRAHAVPRPSLPALPPPRLTRPRPATAAQIYERTTSEWASIAGMDSRIEQLREWLAGQHGQSAPWAGPQLAPCASSGRAWWLWAVCTPRGRAGPPGVQPPP